jgi:biotin carboxyl carrier protein
LHYEIEAGGRLRRISVARVGDAFAVTVDGRLHHVDVARIDAHTLSLIVDRGVSADPQQRPTTSGPGRAEPSSGPIYEATIAPEPGGAMVVLVGATPVTVRLNGRRREGRRTPEASAVSGPQRIAAPMPGRVVRVLVKPGDAVQRRQPVVVVEAMKMENELRADRDGAVAEVHVREGMSVDAGALLIVIQ